MASQLQLECVVVRSEEALHRVIAALVDTTWFVVYRGPEDRTWQVVYDSKRTAEVKQALAATDLSLVTIEVFGGVASVRDAPPGIDVMIFDHDADMIIA